MTTPARRILHTAPPIAGFVAVALDSFKFHFDEALRTARD
jgi:hypothetical protein